MGSFLHTLEMLEGMRRYISAFQAPLQELSPVQIHTLRACSLLVIPPSEERVPPPGGFPMNLSDLNLSGWAALVQDVASGLLALPPNLGSDMSLPAVALLQLLEKTKGWGYCRYCCHLGSRCICMGAYPLAPPQSWSQVVDQSLGYGVTASSGGTTYSSTTAAGMSGYVPPPPGLTPIDFSNWRLLPPEALASRGLPTASAGLPGIGRSIRLRGMAKRITGAQMAQRPGGLAQQTPTLPTLALRMPQLVPPLHQPPPGWLTTLYQQGVQLPKKPTGRGVASDPPTDKTTPVGGTSSQDHRRSNTRGWGGSSRSVSHPRGVQEVSVQPSCQEGDLPSGSTPSVPPPAAPEGTPPSAILCDWQQNFTAVVGRRTWSICSGSTTNSMLPPLRRQNGQGSRRSFLNTSSSIRRKPWASKKDARWTLWPTSKTIFIRPLASTWRASGVSLAG